MAVADLGFQALAAAHGVGPENKRCVVKLVLRIESTLCATAQKNIALAAALITHNATTAAARGLDFELKEKTNPPPPLAHYIWSSRDYSN